MGKQRVRIVRLDWDTEYYVDIQTGNGFTIIEPSGVSIDGVKKKSMYGSLSPLYGTSYDDEQAFIERYRCECGTLMGRMFEGETCPNCHTIVKYADMNINMTGWISLGENKIISPYYYELLQSIIGKKVFAEIVLSKTKITTDGQRSNITPNDIDKPPESPYSFIGIDQFYERYDEVLEYFKGKKKNKTRQIDTLLKEKKKVFVSHIPIYSTMLRPQSVTSDTYYYSGIDKDINTLYSLSEHIKTCEDMERDCILSRIQERVNNIWNINYGIISGKEGLIRDQLLGGNINYSSRNVIIPDPTLHDNEVDISYNTFLELYKFTIINEIMREEDIPLQKAYEIWKHARIFNEKVYLIMMNIVNEKHPKLLINRNPTLNYYSMLLMTPRKVKRCDDDYTLSVPLSILPGLNADFDGDILNIIGFMDDSLAFMFRGYSPVEKMIISRDTGYINDYFSITKGQLIDLYAFACYEGDDECNTPETFPEIPTEQIPRFNLLHDIPYIYNEQELKQWLRPMYIIEDYISDEDTYNDFRIRLYNILQGCFTIKKCRNTPIRFKFTKTSNETYTLPLRMFIINTILWYPFCKLNDIDFIDERFVLSDYNTIPDIEEYINKNLIKVLRDNHVHPSVTNMAISEVLYNLRKVSEDYSLIIGLDFSIPMFIELYENNSEIREIMECTFPETAQPHEIEQQLAAYEKRFISIVEQEPNNPLAVALRAHTGIKHKQLAEFAISEGLKPDLNGQTIPIPIQNSTLIKGTDKPSTQYIDGTAARKSLVMNKKVMGNAGHFGKKTLMATRTLHMSQEITDCGSKHLVAYDIKTKAHLKKLAGKWYKIDPSDEEYELLTAYDTDLIGTTIYVRSAVTCALHDPNCVCARCVGETASTNADIADGIGAFESEEITKVVNQNILSAKHLLTTNSEEIRFNDIFYKFFNIMGGEISPKVDNNTDIPNIEDYAIVINPDDLTKIEEFDEDSLYNNVIENGVFYIRNLANPDEEDIVIQIEGEKEIYIYKDTTELLKDGNYMIKFSDLDDSINLFEVVIYNNELTKPLYSLMHLIDKKADDGIEETIDSMCNKMLDLIIEAKIAASAIACELIINRLIRLRDNIFVRPDFSKDELDPYQIITIRKSLEKNKSPLMGLAFQDIKRQLLSDELFEERDDTSYIDPFFNPIVDASNIKKYRKYMKELRSKSKK